MLVQWLAWAVLGGAGALLGYAATQAGRVVWQINQGARAFYGPEVPTKVIVLANVATFAWVFFLIPGGLIFERQRETSGPIS